MSLFTFPSLFTSISQAITGLVSAAATLLSVPSLITGLSNLAQRLLDALFPADEQAPPDTVDNLPVSDPAEPSPEETPADTNPASDDGDSLDLSINIDNDSGALAFGAGIAPEDVHVSQTETDLILTIGDNGNEITVNNDAIDEIHFVGGTVWTTDDIAALL
ncbi:MAG: hypothetical protein LBE06_04780 [Azoarcus sp.]|nr:hypothetical protein [Azoarcus sp.]